MVNLGSNQVRVYGALHVKFGRPNQILLIEYVMQPQLHKWVYFDEQWIPKEGSRAKMIQKILRNLSKMVKIVERLLQMKISEIYFESSEATRQQQQDSPLRRAELSTTTSSSEY